MTEEDDHHPTLPAPAPCTCLDDLRDVLSSILNKQEEQAKLIKELQAEVGQCINYIRHEALANAAELRKSGTPPEAWPDESQHSGNDEPTQPGRRSKP